MKRSKDDKTSPLGPYLTNTQFYIAQRTFRSFSQNLLRGVRWRLFFNAPSPGRLQNHPSVESWESIMSDPSAALAGIAVALDKSSPKALCEGAAEFISGTAPDRRMHHLAVKWLNFIS